MSTNERVPLWDNMKFFLILLVVIGHFAERGGEAHLFKSIFFAGQAYLMPGFIFISGLFHSNKRISQKVAFFLILYVLMKAIIYVEKLILGLNPSFSLLKEDGIPWFMFAMAAFTLLSYLFREVNTPFMLVFSIIIACFAGYDKSIGDTLVLSRILVFYPFYLAGKLVPIKTIISLRQKKAFRWCALVPFVLWYLACLFMTDKVYFLRPLLTGRNAFNETFLPYGAIWRLLCYLLSTIMVLSTILLVPSKEIKPITVFGTRTLQVYFWHRLIIYLFTYLGLPSLFSASHLLQLVWLGLGGLTAIVLSLKPFGLLTDSILRLSRE